MQWRKPWDTPQLGRGTPLVCKCPPWRNRWNLQRPTQSVRLVSLCRKNWPTLHLKIKIDNYNDSIASVENNMKFVMDVWSVFEQWKNSKAKSRWQMVTQCDRIHDSHSPSTHSGLWMETYLVPQLSLVLCHTTWVLFSAGSYTRPTGWLGNRQCHHECLLQVKSYPVLLLKKKQLEYIYIKWFRNWKRSDAQRIRHHFVTDFDTHKRLLFPWIRPWFPFNIPRRWTYRRRLLVCL